MILTVSSLHSTQGYPNKGDARIISFKSSWCSPKQQKHAQQSKVERVSSALLGPCLAARCQALEEVEQSKRRHQYEGIELDAMQPGWLERSQNVSTTQSHILVDSLAGSRRRGGISLNQWLFFNSWCGGSISSWRHSFINSI